MKKVVFLLDHRLHEYRAPLFSYLSKHYSVLVVHRGPVLDGVHSFEQKIVRFLKVGPFEVPVVGFASLDCDCLVVMQNMRNLGLYVFPFFCRSPALLWGIGTSSSRGLGSESSISKILRNIVTLPYKGLALYSKFPVESYWKINRKKICVVGNSVDNEFSENFCFDHKEYFLFVGALHPRKGLVELISAFRDVVAENNEAKLVIVGGGAAEDAVIKKIKDLGLEAHVQMLGAIYDNAVKAEIFAKAYCVISPRQAGLGVVESFSYGVPFVTARNPITGGEALSIEDEVNGVLVDNDTDLCDVLLSFLDGRRDHRLLGQGAYDTYLESLLFKDYAARFKSFIDEAF